MNNIAKYLITEETSVGEVLEKLDALASDAILFLVDDSQVLIGALTDGDIRRGLIKGLNLESTIAEFTQKKPQFFIDKEYDLSKMKDLRAKNYKIIPIVDSDKRIVDIINFGKQRSYLPMDAVIMAGGKGSRLMPLTENTPKPLLKVGDKPIVEYNTDLLTSYGIQNITFTIKYLGEQIMAYFDNGEKFSFNAHYIKEKKPMGTIGSVSKLESFDKDFLLIMNSDILTNIDLESMFESMLSNEASMIVASTGYEVKIPYGVIETDGNKISSLMEKPTYTYYSNAGIYMLRKECIGLIPEDKHFNATDLMDTLIAKGETVIHYPILGYWLDIGKHNDYEKAQNDVNHIKF